MVKGYLYYDRLEPMFVNENGLKKRKTKGYLNWWTALNCHFFWSLHIFIWGEFSTVSLKKMQGLSSTTEVQRIHLGL